MQDTSYISDTLSRGDLICTVGERHLKFWCFDRSCVDGINISELLAYRLPRSGKGKISTPKTYTCVACVNTSSGYSKNHDFIVAVHSVSSTSCHAIVLRAFDTYFEHI
jgi:hypothetical protein